MTWTDQPRPHQSVRQPGAYEGGLADAAGTGDGQHAGLAEDPQPMGDVAVASEEAIRVGLFVGVEPVPRARLRRGWGAAPESSAGSCRRMAISSAPSSSLGSIPNSSRRVFRQSRSTCSASAWCRRGTPPSPRPASETRAAARPWRAAAPPAVRQPPSPRRAARPRTAPPPASVTSASRPCSATAAWPVRELLVRRTGPRLQGVREDEGGPVGLAHRQQLPGAGDLPLEVVARRHHRAGETVTARRASGSPRRP